MKLDLLMHGPFPSSLMKPRQPIGPDRRAPYRVVVNSQEIARGIQSYEEAKDLALASSDVSTVLHHKDSFAVYPGHGSEDSYSSVPDYWCHPSSWQPGSPGAPLYP